MFGVTRFSPHNLLWSAMPRWLCNPAGKGQIGTRDHRASIPGQIVTSPRNCKTIQNRRQQILQVTRFQISC